MIKKKEDELYYREENPYTPIRKVFKFSSFPKVDQDLKIWFYQKGELKRPSFNFSFLNKSYFMKKFCTFL